MITIRTTKGDIKIRLHDDVTPKTAENFKRYVQEGFYNDTIFHRVIKGFMIQGGGLMDTMEQKPTHGGIENEAKQAAKNKRGTIAMARTMDPHSATAQFFINLVDNHFLDFSREDMQGYGYCVFGEVVEGMDVVDAIANVATTQRGGHADVPVESVHILEVREAE